MPSMPISVLVVDDDPGFRDLASRLLAALGLDVVDQVATVAAADHAREHGIRSAVGDGTARRGPGGPRACPHGRGAPARR
jgi:CheY-like chemotaxis protein